MDKKIIVVASAVVFLSAFAAVADAATCRLVAGKTYYTDGVGNFKDSACRQEMTAAELNSAGSATVNTTAAAPGYGNCRYNSTRQQYTDGTAYFTDSRCVKEALDGETAAGITATQYAQLSQRITALETRLVALQSIMSQILALLAKK